MRFPRCGGRALGVHGTGTFHSPYGRPAIARTLEHGWKVTQAAGSSPDRVLAVEMAANRDPQSHARASARLLRDLEGAAVKRDGIIPAHHALFLVAQNLIDIDDADVDERTGGVGRRTTELLVVLREESLPEVGICRCEGGDLGHAELVDESVLKGAVQALAAAARLWRVGRNMLDPKPIEG